MVLAGVFLLCVNRSTSPRRTRLERRLGVGAAAVGRGPAERGVDRAES
jgi:hypothetical protein